MGCPHGVDVNVIRPRQPDGGFRSCHLNSLPSMRTSYTWIDSASNIQMQMRTSWVALELPIPSTWHLYNTTVPGEMPTWQNIPGMHACPMQALCNLCLQPSSQPSFSQLVDSTESSLPQGLTLPESRAAEQARSTHSIALLGIIIT